MYFTKVTAMCKNDDRQSGDKETGVSQIEVTPEMLSAGWDALLSWDSRDYPDLAMVVDVFEAMILAAPKGWFVPSATSEQCLLCP